MTNVARASLEELLCDYEDFLRQNSFVMWQRDDACKNEIVNLRFNAADEVSRWVMQQSTVTERPIPEIAANVMITLISINCVLLKCQIDAQAKAFENEGGFTERLYHFRKK